MFKEKLWEFTRLFFDEAKDWARGKNWQVRLIFLIWFGYVLARYLSDSSYTSILSWLNLGIHELGHLIFSFLGEFLSIAGGTILQCLAPIFSVVNFYIQRDFFAIALSFGWLSTSLFDAARYAYDARAMNLPLVSPFGGEDVIHDWNYLLTHIGLLQYDNVAAFFIKFIAVISMFVCFVFGVWILLQMPKRELENA